MWSRDRKVRLPTLAALVTLAGPTAHSSTLHSSGEHWALVCLMYDWELPMLAAISRCRW